MRLGAIKSVFPTAEEGVYVKDLSAEEAQQYQDAVKEAVEGSENGEALDTMYHLAFSTFIRDGDGNEFEDARSVEDIAKMGAIAKRKALAASLDVLFGVEQDPEKKP